MQAIQEILEQIVSGRYQDAPPKCRCGADVQHWRDMCPQCRKKQKVADRRAMLSCASSTLPTMTWASAECDISTVTRPGLARVLGTWSMADGSLLVCGPSGSGKTTAVVAKVRRMLREALMSKSKSEFEFARGIRFVTASDVAVARKQHPLGLGDPAIIDTARHATLLVLDELGYEPQVDNAIQDLANYRYAQGRPTFTTSGLRYEEVVERYGVATARKLIGTGKLISLFTAAGKRPKRGGE